MKKGNPGKQYKKIGENIRAWRELKGLKQGDVANKVGISATALVILKQVLQNLI